MRVYREAEAVEALLVMISAGDDVWVGSDVLTAEVSRNPLDDNRDASLALLRFVEEVVELDDESAGVDIFLTTDDRLLRTANRQRNRRSARGT